MKWIVFNYRRWRAWYRLRSIETHIDGRSREWEACLLLLIELDAAAIDDNKALENARAEYLNHYLKGVNT